LRGEEESEGEEEEVGGEGKESFVFCFI